MRVKSIAVITLLLLVCACRSENTQVVKTFSNTNGKLVGDSVFLDGVLQKIVFHDTTLIIDSIVYTRFDKQNIQSINTYVNGKKAFENVEYYESGQIKVYSFLDETTANYFYRRSYDQQGNLTNEVGTPFFLGYLTEIDVNTLEVKKGQDMNIKIFFPNPPHCNPFLYVKLDDSTKADVFYQNEYVSFLKTVSVSNKNKVNGKIWTQIDIWLELQSGNNVLYYNKPIYYKIVD